ncbi:glycosyltransferase [Xanthomonas melonis]|uniref:glycosyltransferase n=1 Tax=Xanthomonas melonis TaxID=56456 RepID=UPI001E2FC969|nr:glycosyltransferase [Xanthomonas melonis]MCD0279220.1 glycosyltransferase [Xanthomonas melonis]
MRILVCAHDYWPNPSPQALRITRLTEELAKRGHDIRVLTRTVASGSVIGSPDLCGVTIVRTSPGKLESTIDRISARRRALLPIENPDMVKCEEFFASNGLNWKGRLIERVRRFSDFFWFPDGRSAWCASAFIEGRSQLLRKPDLILVSHEPAASVRVGMEISRISGIPLVAELGDPICAPYTPKRWLRRASKLEQEVCEHARAVVVTSEATARLLASRHGQAEKYRLIPQGFALAALNSVRRSARGAGLHLVYTGRFYPFRDPSDLVSAVLRVPGCRLTVAGPALPTSVISSFQQYPDSLNYIGQLSQSAAVALQLDADMLVSIGNAGMTQVPGKLMEYLGTGRPIFHVQPDEMDAGAEIVRREKCGFVAQDGVASITSALEELSALKQQGQLEAGLRLGPEVFQEYRWDQLALKLEDVCVNSLDNL